MLGMVLDYHREKEEHVIHRTESTITYELPPVDARLRITNAFLLLDDGQIADPCWDFSRMPGKLRSIFFSTSQQLQ